MPQPIPQTLSTPMQAMLEAWRTMFESGNTDDLDRLFIDEAAFRSLVAHMPYPGRMATILVFRTISTVFEDPRYHRSFATGDGTGVVLEFSANASGEVLKGIDMVRFNAEGKVVEFEIIVRLATSLQALGAAMDTKLGDKIALLRAKAWPAPPFLRSLIL